MIEVSQGDIGRRDYSLRRFLSFGINDLTKMTFSFNRDAAEVSAKIGKSHNLNNLSYRAFGDF